MFKLSVLLTAACLGSLSALGAIDLKESKFTQVVNDVQVISTTDNAKHTATVDGVFKMPDVLRTGPSSRAELVAEDHTITRVGANTIFSFDAANRTINLQQGSLLFNSPKGKGGGTIHTAAATAAVLGTTIIVTTTTNGGFKLLTLEGTAKVKFLNGLSQQVKAGQLMFVLPGNLPGPILNFRLDSQTTGSKLVTGFNKPLASISKVNAQISQQAKQIASGKAADTGMLAGNSATSSTVQTVPAINLVGQLSATSPDVSQKVADVVKDDIQAALSGNVVDTVTPVLDDSGNVVKYERNPQGYLFTPDGTGPAALANALGAANATLTDASITTSTLDPSRVFLAGVTITGGSIVPGTAVAENLGGDNGFFARNIIFNTPMLDLSAYQGMGLSYFDIIAAENIAIISSLSVTQIPGSGLYLSCGGSILLDPGVTLNASIGVLYLTAAGGIVVNSAQIINPLATGEIGMAAGGPIAITGSTITAGSDVFFASGTSLDIFNTTITAPNIDLETDGTMTISTDSPNGTTGINGSGSVILSSQTGMTIGSSIFANTETGSISMNNATGLLTVNNNATLRASIISINSPDGVLIDHVTVQAGTLNVLAGDAVGSVATLQNSTLNVSSLAMTAYTVALNNVNLSGTVNLTSANGQLAANPNTGASVVPGYVNFVQNVNYQNQPAQNFINNGIYLHNIPVP